MPRWRGELDERQRPDHRGVEQEHARVAVLADHPRVHAPRVHPALAGDGVGEPQRLERRARSPSRRPARSPQRRVRYSVITSSGFVTTSATRGSSPASTAVATSSITSTFWCSTSSRLSPGVVWWPAVITRTSSCSISSRPRPRTSICEQQRPRVHEVEREARARRRASRVYTVTRPASPRMIERRRGRDADTTRADDTYSQTRHAHSVRRRCSRRTLGGAESARPDGRYPLAFPDSRRGSGCMPQAGTGEGSESVLLGCLLERAPAAVAVRRARRMRAGVRARSELRGRARRGVRPAYEPRSRAAFGEAGRLDPAGVLRIAKQKFAVEVTDEPASTEALWEAADEVFQDAAAAAIRRGEYVVRRAGRVGHVSRAVRRRRAPRKARRQVAGLRRGASRRRAAPSWPEPDRGPVGQRRRRAGRTGHASRARPAPAPTRSRRGPSRPFDVVLTFGKQPDGPLVAGGDDRRGAVTQPCCSRRNQPRGSQRRSAPTSSAVGGASSATSGATCRSQPHAARAAATRSAIGSSPAGTAVSTSSDDARSPSFSSTPRSVTSARTARPGDVM